MAGERRERNKKQIISDIEDAFLALYQSGGINAVNTAEICRRCGIARSTFYLYFSDKYDILQHVEERLKQELKDICEHQSEQDVCSLSPESSLGVIEHIRANSGWYRALLGINGDPAFVFGWRRTMEQSLNARLLLLGVGREEAQLRSVLFAASLIGLYSYIVFTPTDFSDAELSRYMDSLQQWLQEKQ